MENVKRFVCKDYPKVIAPQKSLEHGTGAHAIVQIFLDKELEQEMHNERRKGHKGKHDNTHDPENNGLNDRRRLEPV